MVNESPRVDDVAVEMARWDRDTIKLIGPAFIELETNGHGSFRFITAEGLIDARPVERDGRPAGRRLHVGPGRRK